MATVDSATALQWQLLRWSRGLTAGVPAIYGLLPVKCPADRFAKARVISPAQLGTRTTRTQGQNACSVRLDERVDPNTDRSASEGGG